MQVREGRRSFFVSNGFGTLSDLDSFRRLIDIQLNLVIRDLDEEAKC
jgi:hypothetical protein